MFEDDFQYPFESTLHDISLNYNIYSYKVKNWRERFYTEFDEQKFVSLLK